MALREIIVLPDPRLRKATQTVTVFDAALKTLTDDMLETMYDAPGIGLAAPQIGVMKRIFVMDCTSREDRSEPRAFINPELTWQSETLETSEEGCLSIPDVYEEVTRPERVRLRWQDLDGSVQEEEFADRPAVCVQHELDHLDGRLFIDHLSSLKRTLITNRMKKLARGRARG